MARMPVAERRARLLEAAFAVIARTGVAGATTRAIVDEAGMKLASFHYAFDSRDDLLAALIEEVIEAQERLIAPAPEPGSGSEGPPSTLEAVLEAGLVGYFEGLRAAPERERAMLELTQYALRTPGLTDLAARQYARYRSLAEAALVEAARRSARRWSVPPAELAASLVALTDGVTLAWLADADDARARRTLAFAARSLAANALPAAAGVSS